jgi:AcrR family transcriptional regulator
MDACLDLFSRQGYAATSVSQIAREAGVSKGLLYNYYSSKQEMLKALFLHFSKEEHQIMEAVVDDDPHIFLQNIIRMTCREIREKKDIWRMITAMSMQPDMYSFIHDIAQAKMEKYFTLLEDLMGKIGMNNPAGEAKMLAATIDGIAMHYLVSGEDYPMGELEDFLIQKYGP